MAKQDVQWFIDNELRGWYTMSSLSTPMYEQYRKDFTGHTRVIVNTRQ